MTNKWRFRTKINDKINNISGNIGVMLLKHGTSNVPQVRHKMMSTVGLSWQQFCFQVDFKLDLIFGLNQTLFTPNEPVRRCRAIWALHVFQVGLSASPYLVEMEIFGSKQKGTGAKSNACHGNINMGVIYFLPGVDYWCQV